MNAKQKRPTVRKSMIVAGFGAAVGLVGATYLLLTPPMYCATARLRVWKSAGLDAGNLSEKYDPAKTLPTEVEFVRSQVVLDPVIAQLGPEFITRGTEGTGSLTKSREAVRTMLEVSPIPKSSILELKVWSRTAMQAAGVANEVARSYAAQRAVETEAITKETVNSLDRPLREFDDKIDVATSNLLSVRQNLLESEEAKNRLQYCTPEQYEQLRSNLDWLQATNREVGERILKVQAVLAKPILANLSELGLASNAAFSMELSALNKAEEQLENARSKYNSNSEEFKEAAKVAKQREDDFRRDLELMVAMWQTESDAQLGQIRAVDSALKSVTTNTPERDSANPQYTRAFNEVEQLKSERERLAQKLASKEGRPTELPTRLNISIVELAEPPLAPAWPNKKAGWGAVLGGLTLSGMSMGIRGQQERARRKRQGQATLGG